MADSIVSISQPWLHPIVRRKTKTPVEFGAKLFISISNGSVRLERQSFDAYNESEYPQEVIERYRKRAENIFCRLAFKAKNEGAERFQTMVED